jgi:hypothetical protein
MVRPRGMSATCQEKKTYAPSKERQSSIQIFLAVCKVREMVPQRSGHGSGSQSGDRRRDELQRRLERYDLTDHAEAGERTPSGALHPLPHAQDQELHERFSSVDEETAVVEWSVRRDFHLRPPGLAAGRSPELRTHQNFIGRLSGLLYRFQLESSSLLTKKVS